MRFLITVTAFFLFSSFCLFSQQKPVPDAFISHKVKKRETLYSISRLYNVSQDQIKKFNPLVDKRGLRKRMILKIPVYKEEKRISKDQPEEKTKLHIVKPKETKWRIAYNFGTTIQELETLNPNIKKGLKINQKIRVPLLKENDSTKVWDSNFNYYTVKPSEGYYRIEKKLGVTKKILDSLNPQLVETGLLKGMVLKLPLEFTGDLKIEDDLLVEKISLIDSMKGENKISIAVMLPFGASEIEFDSISDTRKLLMERNLHTISTDFYSGILMASRDLNELGISVKLSVYDTENRKSKIDKILNEINLDSCQIIIGPLIPSNFDYVSLKDRFIKTPKIAPLSTNKVVLRNAVYQSVTPKEILRRKMFDYLDMNLDRYENIVIVADSLNRPIEDRLKEIFPSATILRPESNGYLLPELIDSLLVDSLPNKVILESGNFSLISSISAQMSAQISNLRKVQLFTTYRGNVYENDNLSRKKLGDLGFTFASGHFPLKKSEYNSFQKRYIEVFGKPPNREAIRAYDLTLDFILRFFYKGGRDGNIDQIGETEYQENRFWYQKSGGDGFYNKSFYLLRHKGYDIYEIKK